MNTGIQTGNSVKEREVVAGIKVIESEYRVQRPVFEDVKIERPVFTNKQVEVPSGFEKVIVQIADEICDKVIESVNQKLSKAIDLRIKEIELPKIVYREEVKTVSVEKPVYKEVVIDRVTYKDKEVINPVLIDVPVNNAIVKDVEVTNAVLKDRVVINPIFTDVEIDKPKYVTKEITVIHPKYIDMKGNPE